MKLGASIHCSIKQKQKVQSTHKKVPKCVTIYTAPVNYGEHCLNPAFNVYRAQKMKLLLELLGTHKSNRVLKEELPNILQRGFATEAAACKEFRFFSKEMLTHFHMHTSM